MPNQLKSPPYVTAEPIITTTKINPNEHDFWLWHLMVIRNVDKRRDCGFSCQMDGKADMIKPRKSWFGFGSADSKLPEVKDVTNDKALKSH